ncbi:MAG TPA: ROK family protein [Bryobacteraceae bacterium]|nr:ROK family protein [Bryobacteraceae bacterium]
MIEYSIGLDLGGTNLRAAAIDRQGHLLHIVTGHTQYSEGREALMDDMVEAIDTVRAKQGAAGLDGIGVVVPGFISLEEGVVRNCNNIPALENFPIRDELSRRLNAPVILENDANAAALGERWMGAGQGFDDLVLLTLGTGIGGGIVANGKMVRGFMGMAGELGHITVVPNGLPCGCGNRGCLEKHASATAITAMARLLGYGDITAKQVYERAVAGDERAHAIFEAMGEALGIALATLVNAFNAPLYLLSGGVIGAWEFFAPPMIEEARRRSFSFRTTNTRVEKAKLGGEAGLYGAAWLPWA